MLIVLERAKSSILPDGNFLEFFLWRGDFAFSKRELRWPWCGLVSRVVNFPEI